MEHQLKTINPHFTDQFNGRKTFEIRYACARCFSVGDTLKLREYDAEKNTYSGRWVRVFVTHILENYLEVSKGFVVMSTERRERSTDQGDGFEIFRYTTELLNVTSTEIIKIS